MAKLRESPGGRMMRAAYQRAMDLYERFEAAGLFEWAPQARLWFGEPSYVSWLGLSSSDPPMHL
jgi:hypothetical protein